MAKALGTFREARLPFALGHSLLRYSRGPLVSQRRPSRSRTRLGSVSIKLCAGPCKPHCEHNPAPYAAAVLGPGRQRRSRKILARRSTGRRGAANYILPGSFVISGPWKLWTLVLREKPKGRRSTPPPCVPVGGAFHSPLMVKPAKHELEKAIAEAPFQTLRVPHLPERGRQTLYRPCTNQAI